MHDVESGLHDIAAIRSMMERASKFLTLSGLSGIGAGTVALAGAWSASAMLRSHAVTLRPSPQDLPHTLVLQLIALGGAILVFALSIAVFFSSRLARRQGRPLWGPAARYLLGALALPLVTGGCLGVVLLMQGHLWPVPGVTLLFYGTGLFAAGSFTFGEIRYLGVAEVLLGLTAVALPEFGLVLWAAGFGALHIIYGGLLYARYER